MHSFVCIGKWGYGFLENAYANAPSVELRRVGVVVAREVPIEVVYEGVVVGLYRAAMIVGNRLLIEVKATKALTAADERQVLNYLRATNLELASVAYEHRMREQLLVSRDARPSP